MDFFVTGVGGGVEERFGAGTATRLGYACDSMIVLLIGCSIMVPGELLFPIERMAWDNSLAV